MANIPDLSEMSKEELLDLQKAVEQQIAATQKDLKRKARQAVEEAAAQYGFTLNELLDTSKTTRSKSTRDAKYRNPENPEQTWSGRGRQPAWFKDALQNGRGLDEMAIAA